MGNSDCNYLDSAVGTLVIVNRRMSAARILNSDYVDVFEDIINQDLARTIVRKMQGVTGE